MHVHPVGHSLDVSQESEHYPHAVLHRARCLFGIVCFNEFMNDSKAFHQRIRVTNELAFLWFHGDSSTLPALVPSQIRGRDNGLATSRTT